ncbi:MAG: hypothetical protein JRN26_00835 [Nitrososphaerota archaeon]|nr:hypothetical protein [Nitrososphaerota archaeon]MDG6927711.1 hypothetical protein [Nitrososphaerota archaeon]MDG6930178.1 hypothetical protein [Nitrososphaerota archaeon]MDG6932051.1 hypothetical protein [Nitrososphaerota archaeon]MDG6935426.1 hypothetical protein [Nitrososphaerota archaeon]
MNSKIPIFIVLALTAAMAFSATPSFAHSQPVIIYSNWGTMQQPITVRPGYTNIPYTVEVQNDTSILYAQLDLPSTVLTNSTGGSIARSTSQSVSPAIFTFTLNVKPSANPGTYSIPIKIVQTDGNTYNFTVSARISPPPSVSASELYWGSTSRLYPYPGYGSAQLTALISNPDSGSIYHVTLNLQLPTGLQSQTSGSTESFYVSEISPGSFEPVTSVVNVTQAVAPGNYYEPYTITYMDSNGAYFTNSGTLELIIYPRTELSVSLNSPGLLEGEYSSINASIKNTGSSPIYDLTVSLQMQGVELAQGNTSQLGMLGSGSSASFEYTIYAPQNLPSGIYPITVELQYESAGSMTQTSYITYASVSSQPQEAYITINPGSIYYMRNNSVTVFIKNAMGIGLKNVQLFISPAQSVYIAQGYGPFFLGNINPNGEANLSLDVMPYFTQDQVYPLQITLQFQGSENYTQSIQQTVPLFINGIITINFSQVQVPAMYNGSSGSVSGTIINSGTEEAYYGTLYINSSRLEINQSQYIGDLPTDSPTPFSYTVYLPSNVQGGSYPVTFTYQYKDSLGNTYYATYSTYMQVISGKVTVQAASPNRSFELLLIVITVIVIIAIVYLFLRRLKR